MVGAQEACRPQAQSAQAVHQILGVPAPFNDQISIASRFFISGLIAPDARQGRRADRDSKIEEVFDLPTGHKTFKIKFRGTRFNEFDRDVILRLITESSCIQPDPQVPDGFIRVKVVQVLENLGRAKGKCGSYDKKALDAVRESLNRIFDLSFSVYDPEATDKDYIWRGRIISNILDVTGAKKSKPEFAVQLNPLASVLFGDGARYFIDLNARKLLTTELAKWLQIYLRSRPDGVVKVSRVLELSQKNSRPKAFVASLESSLNELVKARAIGSWKWADLEQTAFHYISKQCDVPRKAMHGDDDFLYPERKSLKPVKKNTGLKGFDADEGDRIELSIWSADYAAPYPVFASYIDEIASKFEYVQAGMTREHIVACLHHAAIWSEKNKASRKPSSGLHKFFTGWIGRSMESMATRSVASSDYRNMSDEQRKRHNDEFMSKYLAGQATSIDGEAYVIDEAVA